MKPSSHGVMGLYSHRMLEPWGHGVVGHGVTESLGHEVIESWGHEVAGGGGGAVEARGTCSHLGSLS